MEFTVSTREEGPFTVVEVGGEVDVYTAPRLREAVVTAIESGNTRWSSTWRTSSSWTRPA